MDKQTRQLVSDLSLHKPTDGQGRLMDDLREAFRQCGAVLGETLPPGRHRSMAYTALEECCRLSMAAIVCPVVDE